MAKLCNNCGCQVRDEDSFCANCGSNLFNNGYNNLNGNNVAYNEEQRYYQNHNSVAPISVSYYNPINPVAYVVENNRPSPKEKDIPVFVFFSIFGFVMSIFCSILSPILYGEFAFSIYGNICTIIYIVNLFTMIVCILGAFSKHHKGKAVTGLIFVLLSIGFCTIINVYYFYYKISLY